MGALRLVVVLLVAAVAAVGLALTVRQMAAAKPATVVRAEKPMVRVLVAKRDLRIGERLQPEDVAWQTWPAGAVNPAFVTGGPAKASLADKAEAALQAAASGDPAVRGLAGSLVREAILANEPVSPRKLVKGGQAGFMAVKLPAGMRAVSVPVSVESGAGGFILPGDHVDVIQTVKLASDGGGAAQPVQSRTVLHNITVLAIDQAVEPKGGAPALVGASATLQVAAGDVDALAKAKDEGALLLALRSYADLNEPVGAQPRAVERRPVRVSAARTDAVRIYRGGKLTEVQVP